MPEPRVHISRPVRGWPHTRSHSQQTARYVRHLGRLGLASGYRVQPDELPQPSPAMLHPQPGLQMQSHFRVCSSRVLPTPDSRVPPGSFSRATGTRPQVSPELQALEAAVAHSGTDRRGLGSAPSRQTASAGQTRFTQAFPVAKPQDMDCTPPMGPAVLPPLHQCESTDADSSDPQAAQPRVSGAQSLWTFVHRLSWTQEGPHGLRPNWSGPSFWCHGSSTSRGVADPQQI